MDPEFLPATIPGKAVRAYLILICCATRRQTITFGQLGDKIGLPAIGVVPTLNMLHQWSTCRNLPSLSVLVVSVTPGQAGGPFAGQLADQLAERARVYNYEHWTDLVPPTVEDIAGCAP